MFKLKCSAGEKFFLRLTSRGGQSVPISEDAVVEVSDAGVLAITFDEYQTRIYSPNAWLEVRKIDPAGMATKTLLRSGGVPDTPEGIEE